MGDLGDAEASERDSPEPRRARWEIRNRWNNQVEKKRKFLKDSISTLERCMKEIEDFGGLEHMEHKGKTYREQTEIFGI